MLKNIYFYFIYEVFRYDTPKIIQQNKSGPTYQLWICPKWQLVSICLKCKLTHALLQDCICASAFSLVCLNAIWIKIAQSNIHPILSNTLVQNVPQHESSFLTAVVFTDYGVIGDSSNDSTWRASLKCM